MSARRIFIASAVGIATLAAPVMSFSGSTPADQASARPYGGGNGYHPDIYEEPSTYCPPGTVFTGVHCGMIPQEDKTRETAIDIIIAGTGAVFVGSFIAAGLVFG